MRWDAHHEVLFFSTLVPRLYWPAVVTVKLRHTSERQTGRSVHGLHAYRREVFKASVVKRETSDSDKETDTVIQPPAEEAPAAVGPSVHDEAGGASDDEAIEAQRRLRREKALQRQRTAEAEAATKQESSSEDESVRLALRACSTCVCFAFAVCTYG